MDYRELKIGNVVIVEGNVVLSTSFIKQEENNTLKNTPIDFFKDRWEGKKILIIGDNYSLETEIKDIQFTVSFLGVKYLHFLTELTEIADIKANDLVMVLD